jgi:pimeloyl-ACP methyl ester carboxylesterase
MEPWRLREAIETEEGRVRFDRFGSGPPLVLAHGTPFSSLIWRRLAPVLAERWTVHVWDMLGYGSSDMRSGQDVSLAAQTRVLAALLDHWGADEPVVVAHDIGGAVTLRAHLLDRRAYRALVLIDVVALAPWGTPFFRLVQRHAEVFEQIPAYLHRAIVAAYIGNATHRPLPDETLDALVDPWLGPVGQSAFYRQIAQADQRHTDEIQPHYREIRVPTHILWGDHDGWIDPRKARELQALIPGSQLTMVPGAGHLVHEDAPEFLAERVPLVLRELTGDS